MCLGVDGGRTWLHNEWVHSNTDEVHSTRRRFRRFHEGVLAIDERVEPVRIVIDPLSGRPVTPVPPAALEAEALTLHLPSDDPGALHVFGRAAEVDPLRDGACDRWLVYFGKPGFARWMALEVEGVKDVDVVLDGSEVQLPNPLHSCEGEVCRWLNQRPHELGAACGRSVGTTPAAPRAVGLDPYGIDVRATFGVMRLEFPVAVGAEADARAVLEDLLRGGQPGASQGAA
jgi:hypothetical protein